MCLSVNSFAQNSSVVHSPKACPCMLAAKSVCVPVSANGYYITMSRLRSARGHEGGERDGDIYDMEYAFLVCYLICRGVIHFSAEKWLLHGSLLKHSDRC